MNIKTGQVVPVWDNIYERWEDAQIKRIRKNVPSSFDNHIYPILYDVKFLHDGRFSKGHLPFAIKH